MKEKDYLEKAQNYVFRFLRGENKFARDLTLDEAIYLREVMFSYLILQIFEQDKHCFSEQEIADIFLNSKFYKSSAFVDTNEYKKCVKEELLGKEIAEGEVRETIDASEKVPFVEVLNVVERKDNVVNIYAQLKNKEETLIKDGKKYRFDFFSFVRAKEEAQKHGGKVISDKQLLVPKKYHNFDFDDDAVIFAEDSKNIFVCEKSKLTFCEDFFGKYKIKLFKNGKEQEITNVENWWYYLKKIRDKIAHYDIKCFKIDNRQLVKIILVDNENVVAVEERWFQALSSCKFNYKTNTIKAFFLPEHDFVIDNEESCLKVLKDGKLLEITIDKEISEEAFRVYVLNLFSIYRNSQNIKKSIEEFLQDNLLKKFESVEVKICENFNFETLNKRIIKNKDFYLPSPIKSYRPKLVNQAISHQNFVFDKIVNMFYENCLGLKEEDSEWLSISKYAMLDLTNRFFQDAVNETNNPGNCLFGLKFELLIVLCHLTIFVRLVYNKTYDKLNILNNIENKKQHFNLDYYQTEEGKLKLKLEAVDMSMVEIIKTNTKNKDIHAVKTLSDKIFALRIMRNSISHDCFKFQLSKTANYDDAYIYLSLYENQNLSIKLKIKDLFKILNNEFFKEFNEDKKLYENVSKKELLDYIKNLTVKKD